jgi:hypothetical protein
MRGFEERDAADRFAGSTMNSVTSSAAGAVTTNMFLPPVDAATSSIMLGLRWALCKRLDQSIHAAHCTAKARGMTDPHGVHKFAPLPPNKKRRET